jgi:hypothetical protein
MMIVCCYTLSTMPAGHLRVANGRSDFNVAVKQDIAVAYVK